MADHWSIRAQKTSGFYGVISQAGEPTTSQIPDGSWAYWIDTDDSTLYIASNQSGTIKTVQVS